MVGKEFSEKKDASIELEIKVSTPGNGLCPQTKMTFLRKKHNNYEMREEKVAENQ